MLEWGVGGFKTCLFFEVEMIVPDGSAVGWKKEGRVEGDFQISRIGNWIDK